MHKLEVAGGISLASEIKAPNVRRALLCRTGKFDGMYGEVLVTEEILNLICDRYTSDKENPTNDHDFVPILVDHNRSADLCKGRLLAQGMSVEEWKIVDGKMQMGLFGDLRIDDEEAAKNVESGKYAQLSISFDEDTGELYEVSFVAVEAARGSIVLKKNNPQGGDRMQKKNLAMLQAKHKALKSAVGENRTKRKTALSALVKQMTAFSKEIAGLQKKSKDISLNVKSGQIRGKFHEFVRGGKMSPADVKALDVKSLAALDKTALGIVLSAYESRPVSTDLYQYGQKSDKKVTADLSPASMRAAIKLQREGKKDINLAVTEGVSKEVLEEVITDDGNVDTIPAEDMKACMDEMEAHQEKLAECMDKMKELCDEAASMVDEEDSDEEEELKAEDDAKALASEDDADEDEKKKKTKEGEK